MTTPTCSGSKRSASCRAWASVTTTERSAIIIGCSGSMPRRTPASTECGVERLDSVEHLPASGRQVAVRGRAAHQHEHLGAQLGGLVHGGAVVGVALAATRRIGRREEAAAAQARHPEARVANQLCRARHELVSPGREPADPRRGARLHGLRELQVVGGDLVEGETPGRRGSRPDPGHGEQLPHRAAAANAGSASSPAPSARRKSSARWVSVRALSSPPTMRNPSWCPLSQARKTMPVL